MSKGQNRVFSANLLLVVARLFRKLPGEGVMRIERVDVFRFKFPLEKPFTIALGSITEKEVVVRVVSDGGKWDGGGFPQRADPGIHRGKHPGGSSGGTLPAPSAPTSPWGSMIPWRWPKRPDPGWSRDSGRSRSRWGMMSSSGGLI